MSFSLRAGLTHEVGTSPPGMLRTRYFIGRQEHGRDRRQPRGRAADRGSRCWQWRARAGGGARGSILQLAREVPGIEILRSTLPMKARRPRSLTSSRPMSWCCAAARFRRPRRCIEQSWQEFAVNWESDVKIAFHFCKAALSRPLPAGASVVLISSGAALAGSLISGGYAGAKRTQLFIANYSQKESDRLGLGLQFTALRRASCRTLNSESMLSPATPAISAYPRPISLRAWLRRLPHPMSRARSSSLATNPDRSKANVFIVSGKGLEAVT